MMGSRSILSVVVVSMLLISGVAVFTPSFTAGEEGELVETINIEVTLGLESAVGEVYDGELDFLMHDIGGLVYKDLPEEWRDELGTWEGRRSYNNLFINPSHEGYGTPEIEEAVNATWIDEPEEVQWLANDVDGDWTVNPFAHEDIRFAMQYLNRKEIIEELLDDFGDPRYSFMDTNLDVWRDRFVEPIEEEYEMSPEGDAELMEQIIEEAMEEIKENVAFGEVNGGVDSGWIYDGPDQDPHQIEIKIIGRVEDWRLDLADYMADILQDLGFDAWNEPSSTTAIPLVFFGDPEPYDNLAYHIYTGGWLTTETVYYQEAGAAQMYAPWYGFVQTYNAEERWNYDEEGYTERVQHLDNISKELFQGQIETKEDYWEKKVEATQLGFEESLRVFLVTRYSYYVYDPDRLLEAVPNTIRGYDRYFGPRTMFTEDGSLKAAILSGQSTPYMDNWNIYGGSEDIYGEYQRSMAREYNALNHPQTGIPTPVNNYWMDQETFEEEWPERTYPYEYFEDEGPLQGGIEYDFEYEEGELIENIEIPDDAVDYFPEDQEWKTADEFIPEEERHAAVKVTFDVHEEHEWHDGTDFDVQDIMWNYAREKRLGNDTEHDDIYYEPINDPMKSWWDTIHALDFDRETGTYTVWGDYTFPIEPKVGEYYSIDVEANQWTYEGWDFLHATDDYDYAGRGGQTWVHQLSPVQMEDLIEELEDMLARDYLPEYLDAANMPDHMEGLAMELSEVETQVNSVIDFVETYEHAFIGMGPFVITEYDTEDHSMSFERFDNYGYPERYWDEQFRLSEPSPILNPIDLSVPDEVVIGDTETVEATVESQLEESETTAHLYVGGVEEHVETIPAGEEVTFEHTYTFDEAGGIDIEVRDSDNRVLLMDTVVVLDLFELTVDVDGQGDVVVEPDQDEYEEGTKVALTADPAEGWFFSDWTGDHEGTEDEITITMDEDKEITAVFDTEMETYDLAINIDGQGTTDPEEGTHSYDHGTEVTVTATAAEGWYFDRWTGDHEGTDEDITINMDDDKEITAHFEIHEYDLTINIDGQGTTDPEEGTHSYDHGEEITITATPSEGWYFDRWTGDHEGTEDEITIEMDDDKEVTGHFEPVQRELTINIEGEGSTDLEEGTHQFEHGEEVTLTAIPDENWSFSHWRGDHEGTEEEITITMDSDREITAVFEKDLVEYELTIDIEGEGMTEPSEGTHTYERGTEVTVTSTPDEGWSFGEWSGDYDGEDGEITVVMDEDKNVTAVFEEVDEEEEDEEVGFLGRLSTDNWWLILILIAVGAIIISVFGLFLSGMKGNEGSSGGG